MWIALNECCAFNLHGLSFIKNERAILPGFISVFFMIGLAGRITPNKRSLFFQKESISPIPTGSKSQPLGTKFFPKNPNLFFSKNFFRVEKKGQARRRGSRILQD